MPFFFFFRKIIFISSYTEKNYYFLLYELIQDLPYLNFRLGFGFPKQTWKIKNRFYPTMHHSMMSYEDLKKVV